MSARAVLVAGLALLPGCSEADAPPTFYEQLCADHGRATLPPDTPSQHYRMVGQLRFGSGAEAQVQQGEVLLGGPTRTRVQIEVAGGGARNVFLLDGESLWLLSAGSEEWMQYDASLLATEAMLRWEAARFPWGWQEAVPQAAPPSTDEQWHLERAAPSGTLHAMLLRNADGWRLDTLRHEAEEVADAEEGSSGAPSTTQLKLEAWGPGSGQAGAQPMRMIWQEGERIEEWTEVAGRALFLDSAFAPPQGEGQRWVGRPELAEAAPDLTDRLGVHRERLWWISEEDYQAYAEREQLQGHWWRVDGARRFVLSVSPDGDEPATPSEDHWLVWTRYASGAWNPDAQVITQALQQAGLQEAGPHWRREVPDDGRRRLHVLRIPVREAAD